MEIRRKKMTDINKIILVGRLTKNAELKYTNSGTALTKISIAVNKSRKQNDEWINEVSFFDCIVWGKLGESISKYLIKGKQVCIEGELQQYKWEQDGQKRNKVNIVVNNIQLFGGQEKKNVNNSEKIDKENFGSNIPF